MELSSEKSSGFDWLKWHQPYHSEWHWVNFYQRLVNTFKESDKKWLIQEIRDYLADFGHIEIKFVGLQRSMSFERNFYFLTELRHHYHFFNLQIPYNSEFYMMSNGEFLVYVIWFLWYEYGIRQKLKLWWLIVEELRYQYTTNFPKFFHRRNNNDVIIPWGNKNFSQNLHFVVAKQIYIILKLFK